MFKQNTPAVAQGERDSAVLQSATWLNGTAIANATRGKGQGTQALLSMAWQLRGGACEVKPGAWQLTASSAASWARWSLGCNATLATDQVCTAHTPCSAQARGVTS